MGIHDKHYVVISADLEGLSKTENAKRQADLYYDLYVLAGWDCQIFNVSGRYNGIEEQSYAVVMPDVIEDGVLWDKIQDGLIELGDKYEQECLLLVFGADDPPTAAMYPLDKAIAEGTTDYIERPWIEIDCDDCDDLDKYIGLTRVQDKCFIIDEDTELVTTDSDEELDLLLTLLGAMIRAEDDGECDCDCECNK